MTHITRRRSYHSGHRELLHILGHVHLNDGIPISKHFLSQRLGQKGFAYARWAKEHKRTNGSIRIFKIGTTSAQGFGNRRTGFVLTNYRELQFFGQFQETLCLLFLHTVHWNTRPISNDPHHVIFVHGDTVLFAIFFPLLKNVFLLCSQALFFVSKRGGLFKVLLANRFFFTCTNLLDFRC